MAPSAQRRYLRATNRCSEGSKALKTSPIAPRPRGTAVSYLPIVRSPKCTAPRAFPEAGRGVPRLRKARRLGLDARSAGACATGCNRCRCGALTAAGRDWHVPCSTAPRSPSRKERPMNAPMLILGLLLSPATKAAAPADPLQAVLDSRGLQSAYNPVLLDFLTEEASGKLPEAQRKAALEQLVAGFR